MNKFTNPLNNIKVASPCPTDWNEMYGNERKRFCSECKLNVYNLSEMTQSEAENFVINAEGRVCIKFYRRADGTVLTKDCPVGWQSFKKRISRSAKAFTSICAGILGGVFAFNQYQTNPETQVENLFKVEKVESIEVEKVESIYLPTRLDGFDKVKVFSVPSKRNLDEDYVGSVAMLSIEPKDIKKSKKNRKR